MLIKPILTSYTPGSPGRPAVPPYTVCPGPPPPNNGSGGGSSGGGPTSMCFFVRNQYGGMMEICT